MSIATQISRLQNLRNRLRTKILGLGLDTDPQLDLEDCVGIIEGIGGTQNITTTSTYDVAGKQYARVSDANLTPKNIVKNVSILGVVGTASATPQPVNLEARTMFYGGANPPSTVYPSSGYDGLSSVTPELTDANCVLTAGNIKNGVTIMGVTGNYVTPTEAKAPTLADLKTAGITDHSVNVVPSSGKHLSQVTIPRITKDDGTPIQASDIVYGSSILGIQGTRPPYESAILFSNVQYTATTKSISFDVPNNMQLSHIKSITSFATTLVNFVDMGNGDLNGIVINFLYLDGSLYAGILHDDAGIGDTTKYTIINPEEATVSIVSINDTRRLIISLPSNVGYSFVTQGDNGTVTYWANVIYATI